MNIIDRAKRVFEHGKEPTQTCIFCHPIPERVLFETDHFRVLIDTYPIVPGHLLISTKSHYGNAGELPDSLKEEFLQIKKEVKSIALQINSSTIFYEHGKAGSCHSSSPEEIVCEHFHFHCLPIVQCIHHEIAKKFTPISLSTDADFFAHGERMGSYLYFENSWGTAKIYPAGPRQVPPHFLRTLICQSLQIGELAEWQAYNRFDRYLNSLQTILDAFQPEDQNALS